MSPVSHAARQENRILDALHERDYRQFRADLRPVVLPFKQRLFEPMVPIKYVYFPTSGLISVVHTMQDGAWVEVGVVGKDGLAGLPVVLGVDITPNLVIVQVKGEGFRMRAETLREHLKRNAALQVILLRYAQIRFNDVSKTAACNRLHRVEQRLARWLLLASDRLESDKFALTQEFIATMLGSRRAGVTLAASTLYKAELIDYKRGKIQILDRDKLKAVACECYSVMRSGIDARLN